MFATALILTACQSGMPRGDLTFGHFPAQDSGLFVAPSACLQNVTVLTEKETGHYQLVYDATSEVHRLLILSMIGQRLVTVTQQDRGVAVQKSLPVSLTVSPKELLLAMQLIYWPVPVLQQGIRNSEWRITEENSTRSIYKGDVLQVTIEYRDFSECTGVINYRLAGGDSLLIESVSF
jgi:hypothetical protein